MDRRELNKARRTLIDTYTANRNETPEKTVSILVDSIGYDTAVEIVAAMVIAKGEWDARISRRCREWAAQHCDVDQKSLAYSSIYYCDEIHPAHMDQICTAMMEYQPTTKETETDEETAEVAEAVKAWENEERAVTLTNDQWNTLTCYILMTTQHRKGEREAWESLAKETNEDGTPKFKNAASNAKYYADLEKKLEVIRNVIDR